MQCTEFATRMSFPSSFPELRVALVHDWLTGMRGGEKVLEALCALFPEAPIHSLVAFPDALSDTIARHPIHTSMLQRFPQVRHRYRQYLPFFPAAIRSLDLRGFDLIISSSHAVAKAVRVPPGAMHIAYIHTPMRYVWDLFDQYFGRDRVNLPTHLIMRLIAAWLRRWDVRSTASVDHLIANSEHVRERIRRHWGRDAIVIHPPVDTSRFSVRDAPGGHLLVFSALVPYKRVDLAIRACSALGLPLVVAGTGPEEASLRAIAGPTVRFHGWVNDDDLPGLYAGAQALLFPGEEDFGIIPLEAMAAGTPVIAFGRGGACETVVDGVTGVLFAEQTEEALIGAIRRCDAMRFDPHALRAHAEGFDVRVFQAAMQDAITRMVLGRWGNDGGSAGRAHASR